MFGYKLCLFESISWPTVFLTHRLRMLSRMGGRRPEKEIHEEKHAPQAPCALEPRGHPGFPGGSVGKESACNVGDQGSILGLGRSPGEGNGNPFQYSCLENLMDRAAWQATVHGVARIGHNLVTKPPPVKLKFYIWFTLSLFDNIT